MLPSSTRIPHPLSSVISVSSVDDTILVDDGSSVLSFSSAYASHTPQRRTRKRHQAQRSTDVLEEEAHSIRMEEINKQKRIIERKKAEYEA